MTFKFLPKKLEFRGVLIYCIAILQNLHYNYNSRYQEPDETGFLNVRKLSEKENESMI